MLNLRSTRFYSPCILDPKLIVKNVGREIWIGTIPYCAIYFQDLKSGKKKLYLIKDIKVPRFYGFNELKGDTGELNVFNDLLQLAYEACTYFHIIQRNDIKILLIIVKPQLAPLNSKVLTILKLELQAAVIASKMKRKIVDESQITVNDLHFWSDSQAILKYIKKQKSKVFSLYYVCIM